MLIFIIITIILLISLFIVYLNPQPDPKVGEHYHYVYGTDNPFDSDYVEFIVISIKNGYVQFRRDDDIKLFTYSIGEFKFLFTKIN